MRFITRCPSCGTTFRVVVDQLKIADGWVRCGFCQRVFDATQDLQPEVEPAAPAPAAVAVTTARPAPQAEPTPSTASQPQPRAASDGAPPPTQAPAPPSAAPVPSPPASPDAGHSDAVPSQAPSPSAAASTSAGPEPTAVPPPAAGAVHAGGEPAFVRAARRRARWRHPWVRWTLAATALLLAGVLAAQLAWLGRDALLARWPGLQPAYAWMCAPLGCTVGPRRDPQAVVVEGSVLLRRAPDRYSFHLVLRNQTEVEVAAPALELTLVDAEEQAMVRRVWMPHEWPQPTATLGPGAEWPLQFELAFDHPQASRMSGYRVVLFFP